MIERKSTKTIKGHFLILLDRELLYTKWTLSCSIRFVYFMFKLVQKYALVLVLKELSLDFKYK